MDASLGNVVYETKVKRVDGSLFDACSSSVVISGVPGHPGRWRIRQSPTRLPGAAYPTIR